VGEVVRDGFAAGVRGGDGFSGRFCTLATGLDKGVGFGVAPPDESAGPRALEIVGIPVATVHVEGLRENEGAEKPVEDGEGEEAGDGFVAIDDGVVAQVEAVDLAPEPAEVAVFDERRPAFERPVLDRVKDFVKREREGESSVSGEEPRERGREPLKEREERRDDGGEDGEGIPREEGSLALLGFGDGVDVFDKRHGAAAGCRAPADARERMVERVLLVEAVEERDDRLVEDVAVKDVFKEARQEVHQEKRREEAAGGGGELSAPDGVGCDELQKCSEAGEGGGNREEKERKREFFLDVRVAVSGRIISHAELSDPFSGDATAESKGARAGLAECIGIRLRGR